MLGFQGEVDFWSGSQVYIKGFFCPEKKLLANGKLISAFLSKGAVLNMATSV